MSERSVVFMFSGQGSHYYQIDTVSLRHGAEELRQVDLGTGLVRKPVSGCEAPGLARIASRIASRGGAWSRYLDRQSRIRRIPALARKEFRVPRKARSRRATFSGLVVMDSGLARRILR